MGESESVCLRVCLCVSVHKGVTGYEGVRVIVRVSMRVDVIVLVCLSVSVNVHVHVHVMVALGCWHVSCVRWTGVALTVPGARWRHQDRAKASLSSPPTAARVAVTDPDLASLAPRQSADYAAHHVPQIEHRRMRARGGGEPRPRPAQLQLLSAIRWTRCWPATHPGLPAIALPSAVWRESNERGDG